MASTVVLEIWVGEVLMAAGFPTMAAASIPPVALTIRADLILILRIRHDPLINLEETTLIAEI
ncbi:MAG: hypothetical protein CME33_01445 [Gimesia sp.]|nr:hypothetical protein [Gimesia sp.]